MLVDPPSGFHQAAKGALGPRGAGSALAKKESDRSGAGGGKIAVRERSNSAWICVCARRTVAVEATSFGRILFPSTSRQQSVSSAVSYSPAIEPSGPEIRCNWSWMIRSGGGGGAGK
jgi:hypothetical protein